MASGNIRSVASKYRYVQGLSSIVSDEIKWVVHMKGVGRNGFDTEREAALAADKYLISKGRKPVNILKAK